MIGISLRERSYFPNHIDLDEFILDFCNREINAWEMQKKYTITPRQYRLVARYLKEEKQVKPYKYKSPQRKYIYRDKYGSYIVKKRVGGVFKHFGSFRKLDDAIRVRDKLKEVDWDESKVVL